MGRLIRHDVVDSTNERALAAVAAGEAEDGDLHVARGQTAGRGRLGRTWQSPADEGLYASLIHLPTPPAPPPEAVTMAAGLALLDAALELGLEGARLDWPNDLVHGNAKLAGILVEARGMEAKKPHFVVGLGVNVRQRAFPEELVQEREVVSLALLGLDTTPKALLELLAPRLEARLLQAAGARDELARDYLRATGLRGRTVRMVGGGATVAGSLEALDLSGGLRVRTPAGELVVRPLAHVRELTAL